MNEISFEDIYSLKNPFIIDVRSPGEYTMDHIPGSVNMPLFDDKERSEIGRIYRLLGQDDAVVKGSEIAGGRIGDIVAKIHSIKEKEIIIYCFRGGMRSSALVSLLTSLNYNVYKLKDGYKGYRRYVSERLSGIKVNTAVFVLQGLTGTGKTEIIRKIKNSIDLEGIAGHRSSVFGGIGLKQKTQKMFESLLLKRIDDLSKEDYIVMEGESRKIGNLHIPDRILEFLNNSPTILINASLERRVEILLREYTPHLDSDVLIPIIKSLDRRIGKKNVTHLVELFRKGELYDFTQLLLEKYYDPLYEHSLKKMKFIAEIENVDEDFVAAEVEKVIFQYLQSRNPPGTCKTC